LQFFLSSEKKLDLDIDTDFAACFLSSEKKGSYLQLDTLQYLDTQFLNLRKTI